MTWRRHLVSVWLASSIFVAAAAGVAAGQWPQFRGPNGSGVEAGAGFPVAFSPSTNVIWKTAVPFAQSSPIVVGQQVYLTASEGDQLLTISLDAATGRELWRRQIKRPRAQKTYRANDPASPTPAADNDGDPFSFLTSAWPPTARTGKDRWTLPLGPFNSFYGMAASPILTEGLVVLVCDQRTGSFIVALDRKTGQVRWKRERAGAPEGWATPMVFAAAGGPAQLICTGHDPDRRLCAGHR